MEPIPEITTDKQISDKLTELTNLIKLVSSLISELNKLKVKLKLDFSSDCSEFGKSSELIQDCRDKFIDTKIQGLNDLLKNLSVMYESLNPDKAILNRDYNKTFAN